MKYNKHYSIVLKLNMHECTYPEWTIKIFSIFGYRIRYIKITGYSIDFFNTRAEANRFMSEKKSEIFEAYKYLNK